MVTPLFRAGGNRHNQKSRLEDGTLRTAAVHCCHVFQTRAVLQTDGLLQPLPPVLKGGVTSNVALQAVAACSRQKSVDYLKCRLSGERRLSDVEYNTNKGCCLPFVVLQQPFSFKMVREMGLEPTLLSELEPKSNASASSATLA